MLITSSEVYMALVSEGDAQCLATAKADIISASYVATNFT
jgi:hypothetical protein